MNHRKRIIRRFMASQILTEAEVSAQLYESNGITREKRATHFKVNFRSGFRFIYAMGDNPARVNIHSATQIRK